MADNSQIDPQLKALLDTFPYPVVSPQHKAELLAEMTTLLPEPKTRWQLLLEWYPCAVLLSQLRVIRSEIWAASSLILGLGMVFTLIDGSANGAFFAAIAPIVASAGVAMLYDQNIRLMLEIEETTRASAPQLLMARLALVFGFNLVLALIGSVILALFSTQISLVPLIVSWLAPMFFLSALAFFLGILLVDTIAAATFSLILWVLNLMLRNVETSNDLLKLISMPGLSDPTNRPFLMFVAAILVLVTVWLIDVKERYYGRYA